MIGFAGGLASRYRGIDLVTSTSGTVVDEFVQTDDNTGQALSFHANVGVAQSWTAGSEPNEVAGVLVRLRYNATAPSGVGIVRLHVYAHSGTLGTSSVPTGSALVSSEWYAADLVSSATNYFFPVSGFTPTASTNYTVVVEHDAPFGLSGNALQAVIEDGAAADHGGNVATQGSDSSWSANSGQDMAFKVYESEAAGSGPPPYRERGNSFNRRRFGGLWALLSLLALGCTSPTAMRADPCFAMTLHVDTLTLEVDSITYEWTPGECD